MEWASHVPETAENHDFHDLGDAWKKGDGTMGVGIAGFGDGNDRSDLPRLWEGARSKGVVKKS